MGEFRGLGAAQVEDASHTPCLGACHRAADALGTFEAHVTALARLLGVAEVPQHEREIGERADAGVTLRLVDVVGPAWSPASVERLFEVRAGEVELRRYMWTRPR